MIGPDFVNQINGMFAIVIYDTSFNKVFIARDRLGIKPLYVYKNSQNIIVSSEIAPILSIKKNFKIDPEGVRQYKKLRAFFNGKTLYSGINMFPAGHYQYDGKITRYWELPFEPNKLPPSDDELLDLIQTAVDYRCISDVPVGSYLSGGIDSTIITALANKTHSWTVGFKDNNEFNWAKIGAENLNTVHHQVNIEYDEFCEIAREMINTRKEPLSVPNEVLLYKMTKKVKKENTVVLSGEGADELFFGYDRIFRWASNSNWSIEEFDQYYSYGSSNDLEIVEDALSPFMGQKKSIDIVANFFQISHLHGLLRRLDNSTMLSSVEARVPFVDHRIIERMAGVSIDYRMKNGVVKEPLKRLYANRIPKKIITRKKVGFPVPLEKIFNQVSNKSFMDQWLQFNLRILGVE